MHEHRAGWGNDPESWANRRRSRANTCWSKATKTRTRTPASIDGAAKNKDSNTVEVEILDPELHDRSRNSGSKAKLAYTTAKLKAEVGADRGIQDHGLEHGEHDPEIRSAERREMHEHPAALGETNSTAGESEVVHVRTRAGRRRTSRSTRTSRRSKVAGKKKNRPNEVEVEVEEPATSRSTRNSGSQGEPVVHDGETDFASREKVEYKITVTNTGNTTFKFSALKDAKCTNIAPAGETTLKAGRIGDVHVRTRAAEGDENPYKNTASISGGGKEKTSNTVEVEKLITTFTIHKEQRIQGEAAFTTGGTDLRSREEGRIQDHGHEHREHDDRNSRR